MGESISTRCPHKDRCRRLRGRTAIPVGQVRGCRKELRTGRSCAVGSWHRQGRCPGGEGHAC